MSEYFHIHRISAGWFEGSITDKSNQIFFDASYITDFPTGLMNAMLYALGRLPKDEEEKASFRSEYEPAIGKWHISKKGNSFVIHEFLFPDDFTEKASDSSTVSVPIDAFLHDFLSEMRRIINMFGLVGYRSEWGHEFPLSLYLQLWDVYQKGEHFITKEVIAEGSQNMRTNYQMTDFAKECDVISALRIQKDISPNT